MEVLHRRCAGLDVHQAQVAACVRVTPESGQPWAQAQRFDTTPSGIAALRDWLTRLDVTHVAMEGTGVYWLPIYTALEPGFDLTLCNAHHVKNVPGRKTDQSDAAWLAQLLASGLLRKSFVPPADVRQVRELTRARVHRVEDRARTVNGMHRLLERAGVKLCSVVSDLQTKSAIKIMEALVAGEADPRNLAELARGSLRGKRVELAAVLAVTLTGVERMMLGQLLDQLSLYDRQVDAIDKEVAELVRPWQAAVDRLKSAPGIDDIAAMAIIGELGPDVAAFDDPHRLAAWAGLAPGQRLPAPDPRAECRRHQPQQEEPVGLDRVLPQEDARSGLQEGCRRDSPQAPRPSLDDAPPRTGLPVPCASSNLGAPAPAPRPARPRHARVSGLHRSHPAGSRLKAHIPHG
jgi:transposase